ncbi:MAG: hypothetical protein V7604_3905, partial [Hyphomicrobiales bacterium]
MARFKVLTALSNLGPVSTILPACISRAASPCPIVKHHTQHKEANHARAP